MTAAGDIEGENGFALMGGAPCEFPGNFFSAFVTRLSAVAIVAAIVIATLLAGLWLWLLKNHTRKMVWGTIGMTVVLQLGLAVLLFAAGNPSAVFLLIMTGIYCLIIYCIRKFMNILLPELCTVTSHRPCNQLVC